MNERYSRRKAEYLEKLRDPRWQKKRLQILERDGWACRMCSDTKTTLNVHHRYYQRDAEPWDYPDFALVTLCENCHREETEARAWAANVVTAGIFGHLFSEEAVLLATALHVAMSATGRPSDVVARTLVLLLHDGDRVETLIRETLERLRLEERQGSRGLP